MKEKRAETYPVNELNTTSNSAEVRTMKASFLFTASGAMVILTSYDSIHHPELLKRIRAKGINKFIACEIPVDLVKQRYGGHFDVTCEDLHETDDLRVVDFNGERAFRNFDFKELGKPVFFELE